jgi:hypothetical protein
MRNARPMPQAEGRWRGFTYRCPINIQCLWTADCYGAGGVQLHRTGSLLRVELTSCCSGPGRCAH